jgi:lysophospholipase L1-like esterase
LARTRLQDGQTILFIGDSITDCGRREDRGRPLGLGYVRFFNDLLIAREPEKRVNVVNRGIGGNTIEDLRSRWHDDVLAYRPDWLSIKIGINDVNRHLTSTGRAFLPPEEYRDIYLLLLELTRDALPEVQILLIDPFFISRDTLDDSYRCLVLRTIEDYIAVVHEMSERFATLLVPTHEIFQRILDLRPAEDLTPEPVHPHATGHMVIAQAVYDALSI